MKTFSLIIAFFLTFPLLLRAVMNDLISELPSSRTVFHIACMDDVISVFSSERSPFKPGEDYRLEWTSVVDQISPGAQATVKRDSIGQGLIRDVAQRDCLTLVGRVVDPGTSSVQSYVSMSTNADGFREMLTFKGSIVGVNAGSESRIYAWTARQTFWSDDLGRTWENVVVQSQGGVQEVVDASSGEKANEDEISYYILTSSGSGSRGSVSSVLSVSQSGEQELIANMSGVVKSVHRGIDGALYAANYLEEEDNVYTVVYRILWDGDDHEWIKEQIVRFGGHIPEEIVDAGGGKLLVLLSEYQLGRRSSRYLYEVLLDGEGPSLKKSSRLGPLPKHVCVSPELGVVGVDERNRVLRLRRPGNGVNAHKSY